MRIINHFAAVLCLSLLVSATKIHGKSEFTFQYLGELKPRHARTIRSSNWSIGTETMDRDYTIYRNWSSHLGPLGFKKARLQAGWAKTEHRKAVYDWHWLDEMIFDMAEQGVEPCMCLCYGNTLYSEGGTGLGAGIPCYDSPILVADKSNITILTERQARNPNFEIRNNIKCPKSKCSKPAGACPREGPF